MAGSRGRQKTCLNQRNPVHLAPHGRAGAFVRMQIPWL